MRVAAQTVVTAASTSGRPAPGAARPTAGARSAPRRAPGSSSSSSGRPSAAPQQQWQRRRHGERLPPPAVTNEGREMRDPSVLREDEDEYITIDPELPQPGTAHFGIPLERRIGTSYEDAVFKDEVDPEATEWWFTEPAGGWPTEKRRLRKLEVAEEVDTDDFAHAGAAAEGRTPLELIREGQVVRGTVVAQLLYHGAQVDIGAQWDALLPVQEDQWEEAAPFLQPGDEIEIRVHKLRDARFFRFPIQAEAVDRQLATVVMPPDAHIAPIDVREPTMSMEEIAAATGREWEVAEVTLQDEAQYDYSMDEAQYDYSMGADLYYKKQERYQFFPEEKQAMDEHAAQLMQGW
ncbi:PLASTID TRANSCRIPTIONALLY ACTIVE 10-like isoform B [Chlorella sorokiniana]|uniref:PLASTID TRANSCRIPTIONALLY ACTIVE 10-like isoform A n=1 Tax=Chlorella sorokiniana TaxID=3076 RepID=A0A2P6TKQ1_CHLSO|nr:PLASTID TRANSCRIPTIONALLY ACTIVE 10-like isoform A [Chlorella sorokiniana]PRW44856.1 PLASTID TRANSCRIPTIONALLY ACTIVE 10-like isoform B [Chlorella sorokiniana]|eukprot:PRW44854.1 PLASTID TRANSCRIPTIONALLY ACTIVE 10-like isoform A [Chlorella sorokiniana]